MSYESSPKNHLDEIYLFFIITVTLLKYDSNSLISPNIMDK